MISLPLSVYLFIIHFFSCFCCTPLFNFAIVINQVKDTKIQNPLTYVSKVFFDFICVLENTFLANANIRMMIAYSEGDLFDAMIMGLKSEQSIFAMFKTELKLEEFNDDVIFKLLDDILTRFKHIRGSWFIKKIKGQKKQTSTHSTRKHVQVKTEIAAASADVRASMQLKKFYTDAANNIRNKEVDLDEEDDDDE